MVLRDFVALIQLGFAGFAAAMALLSYRLVRLQAVRKNPDLQVLEWLRNFTKYTLYLSLIVILATVLDRSFDYAVRRLSADEATKARQVITASQHAQDCRESLSGLVGAEASDRSPEQLHEIMRLTHAKCSGVMQSLEMLK